jgi:hypothetical protein
MSFSRAAIGRGLLSDVSFTVPDGSPRVENMEFVNAAVSEYQSGLVDV